MKLYTLGEEIAHSVSHGIGALLSIAGLVVMIVFASLYGNAYQIVSVSIYGVTLVLLYTMSTLYHAISNKKAKKVFRALDHSSIYLLIAGTYTPFTLVVLRQSGMIGWVVLITIWILAVLGIIFSSITVAKSKVKVISSLIYIAMGWAIVFCMPQLIDTLKMTNSMGALYLLAIGGITYTLGVIFYAIKIKYFHFIWHLFVLAGSTLHFIAVMAYIL